MALSRQWPDGAYSLSVAALIRLVAFCSLCNLFCTSCTNFENMLPCLMWKLKLRCLLIAIPKKLIDFTASAKRNCVGISLLCGMRKNMNLVWQLLTTAYFLQAIRVS